MAEGHSAYVRTTLLPHQEQAVQWLLQRERYGKFRGGLLNDSEGLGKSLCMLSLMTLDKERKRKERTATLVLVNHQEQIDYWVDELRRHGFANMFKAKKLTLESPNNNVEADLVLFSYALYTNLHADLVSVKWRRIIFDDAHYIEKLPNEMIQHLKLLDAECKWALTGKPILNSSHDVAPLLTVLGFEQLRDLNLNDLRLKISLRRTRQVLGLPPRNIDIQSVDFSPRERELYDEEMNEARALLVRLESFKDDKINNDSAIYNEYEKVGEHLHRKIIRLIRICTDSAMYYCDSDTDSNPSDIKDASIEPSMQIGSSSKIDALVKHVMKSREECSNRKSLIFSEEDRVLLSLESQFKMAGFKTWLGDFGRTLTKCNAELQAEDGATVVFASSIAVMGMTPHLKEVSTVYLMQPFFSPEIEDRIIEVVHCIGQEKTVNIVKFIVKNSIEERILELQQIKREMGPEAFDVHRHTFDLNDIQFVMKK